MRFDKWKIYDKKGSGLNISRQNFLTLDFVTDAQNARGAEGYAFTDPSALITDGVITNSGYNYPSSTVAFLDYALADFSAVLSSAEASIGFIDVSVFNPNPSTVSGIGSINLDVSTLFTYPATILSAATFMPTVSTQLVETEHLTIFEESSTGEMIRPYDPINSTLVFRFTDGDEEIKFFEVDQDAQTLTWADELTFDISEISTSPIIINVGFRSEDDGVFERILRAFHKIGDQEVLFMEIVINSQSVGPDERFDTLAQNFGLPNPKDTPFLFKEADINESMPDWKLLNYKGKHIVLEHDQITPYIGSYKALINAIKWLGYEDIKVKEWYRDVKESKKLGLYVPYEAEDRTKTILYFSPEERRNLKKLNELSLVYCITRETGEVDEWGNPLVEECYSYNIGEILTKLKALKDWLEKKIIGVNARITDVTGEGVYFERFQSFIYATQDKGSRAEYSQSLTPDTIEETSELVMGEASIGLTLKEISETKTQSFRNVRIGDLLQYYWDPSNGAFAVEDASDLWWDPSTIAVGNPFKVPFLNLYDIQYKLSLEKPESGVLPPQFITNPLWVYNNEIRFYEILDSSAVFYESSTGLRVRLEEAYIRDASNDNWTESLMYSVYQDPSDLSKYILESSTGSIWTTDGAINFRPDTNSRLEYAFDDNYKVPLLSMENYVFTDSSADVISLETDKKYFLDILDGKISMKSFIQEPSSFTSDPSAEFFKKEEYFVNWTYDSSLDEQKITLNVVYSSPKAPLYLSDPSTYYYQGPEAAVVLDNSIYIMNVNHIGAYEVEVFGWDGQNNVYRNFDREEYEVWTQFPQIWSYLDTSCPFGSSTTVCPSAMLTVDDISTLANENLLPIFDRQAPLQGLTLEQDGEGKYYINVPSISFFVDNPDPGTRARFYNMTERVVTRSGDTFTVDPDFQSFNNGDDVNLVLFDRGKYNLLSEVSGNISGVSGNDLTITGIPAEYVTDSSTEVYLLNDTRRETYGIQNDLVAQTVELDISAYQFETNQLVGIIIDDASTGYSWGAAFRVLDSSIDGSIGVYHQLKGNIPEFILADPSRYEITAKHAFSTYSDFDIEIDESNEANSNFEIYLDDIYYHQYYLDNTFVYVNVLFDQEKVLDQWYDPSTDGGLVTGPYYPYAQAITVDVSTLIILDTYYDPSNYMLNQKNLWTVTERDSGDMLFRVYNKSVPYIFDEAGTYNVQVEAYDSYGNLKTQFWEGLITVE